MMKKLLLYSLLFLSFSSTYAQNYIDYHRTVVKAEAAVLSDDYDMALVIYDDLFKSYDFVYAIDYFTATQLAVVTQQYASAFKYLRKGVERGISMKLITGNEILSELVYQNYWESFEKDYEKLHEKYLKSTDRELCEAVQELYQKDVLMISGQSESGSFSVSYSSAKFKKLSRRNAEQVIDLIRQYGFPGERQIGLEECNNTLTPYDQHIVGNNVMLQSKMAFIILMHHYSEPNRAINEVLIEEVKKGNMPPSQYAIINDYLSEWGNGRFGDFHYYYESKHEINTNEENIIDQRRAVIGLGSYQHKMAKRQRWIKARKNENEGRTIYIRP